MKKRSYFFLGLVILCVVSCKKYRGLSANLGEFIEIVSANHWQHPSTGQLEGIMAVSALKSLDNVSSLKTDSNSGSVGIIFSHVAKKWVITQVSPGSGASDADIRPGDEIIDINGREVPTSSREIVRLLNGPVFSKLNIKIIRFSDSTTHQKSVIRKNIEFPAIDGGYKIKTLRVIRIVKVNKDAARLLSNYFSSLTKDDCLVLDLRSCSEGDADGLQLVASVLSSSGKIVAETGMEKKVPIRTLEMPGYSSWSGKIYILVSRFSGGEAKVLSQFLKSNINITIVGEPSGQSALLKKPFEWNGSKLILAVSPYFSKEGKNLSDELLQPDLALSISLEELTAALDSGQYLSQTPIDKISNVFSKQLPSDIYISACLEIEGRILND